MNNKQKSILNIGTSIFSQIVILVFGLIVPRIILVHYGSDTNGLTSTISQIFTYMALLQSGISQAARNALYKPIKDDDKQEISFYLSAARRYYRKISRWYLLAVIALALIVPLILKTEIGYWTVAFYVFFEGLVSVVSFYFINTWTCFLNAKGDVYIVTAITLFNQVLCYLVKIVLSIMGMNIALIQVGYFAVSLLQLAIYYLYMRKKYGWINYNEAPKGAKLPDRSAYIVTEVAWTMFSSTDMIVLSIFVSTSLASVYSVYNMVFVALNGLLNAVYNAVNYNLGRTYVEDIEKYKKVHDLFHSFFMSCMTILMCVAYLLIIPFVRLYTAGVEDINYIYPLLPVFFCLTQLLSWSRYIAGNLINVAGRIKTVLKVSIAEALINVVLSVILVQFLDITGVLFGTVAALPLKVVCCNYIADIKILHRSIWKTVSVLLLNYGIFAVTVIVNLYLDISVSSYLYFILMGVLLTVIYSVVVFAANMVVNRDILRVVKVLFARRRNKQSGI